MTLKDKTNITFNAIGFALLLLIGVLAVHDHYSGRQAYNQWCESKGGTPLHNGQHMVCEESHE